MGTSDQSRSEAEIELRRQLDRVNADFEEFISMAAHHLRQSLRDVTAYSQLMSQTYAARLDSDAAVFLARIQDGAASMESLLADAVDYWAVCDGGLQSARTDLEAALGQALLFADKQITERRAVVTHDPLPVVTGNFEMLTKMLHHLIENAIEYCLAPSPRVRISSRRVDLDWVISVEDNGPGIEPAFQDRVFETFKRLHGKEHPGNGLGLAFCRKVIEWHGGRMWIESTPGAGSTFFFTLPAAD
jgi:light-regulated signal transduction histidine kinase (bacteriophytochrome)